MRPPIKNSPTSEGFIVSWRPGGVIDPCWG